MWLKPKTAAPTCVRVHTVCTLGAAELRRCRRCTRGKGGPWGALTRAGVGTEGLTDFWPAWEGWAVGSSPPFPVSSRWSTCREVWAGFLDAPLSYLKAYC